MTKSLTFCALLLLLPVMAAHAEARPEMQMERIIEKEVQVLEHGKPVLRRVATRSASVGDVLVLTLRYRNQGKQDVVRADARNAIPAGMQYLPESASGHDCEIRFSIDGGKTFRKAAELKKPRLVDGKRLLVQASPSDYTHIQWTIGRIRPGEQGELAYRVRMM